MHFWWGAEAGSDAGPLRAQRQAAAGAGLLQAASGERHALLLLTNHTVHACGDNSRGQLGRRGVLHRERPDTLGSK
ncbi:probable E3 ubiquitin-protein ligase HERC6 [Heterocephalus glaber]|uniref:Probable E3 ubiquitin-protein ligase HERC6 n=1 Tax=Heterocephalus glaber TaxID=10181 RepID=A0AAX6R089_HETGA|nr:probable E3 ubiquitin-protein ligase HERC6 [Heterocephalus glaber]